MNQTEKKRQSQSGRKHPDKPVTVGKKTNELVPVLLDWFAANARDLPWRRKHDLYAIWMGEIIIHKIANGLNSTYHRAMMARRF